MSSNLRRRRELEESGVVHTRTVDSSKTVLVAKNVSAFTVPGFATAQADVLVERGPGGGASSARPWLAETVGSVADDIWQLNVEGFIRIHRRRLGSGRVERRVSARLPVAVAQTRGRAARSASMMKVRRRTGRSNTKDRRGTEIGGGLRESVTEITQFLIIK